MGTNEVKKITAWSFSRWSTYEQCPFLAKCKFVDRLPEPVVASPAIERGIVIHKMAEDYVVAEKQPRTISTELKMFHAEFKEARKGKPFVEREWAFTSSWEPTGWFAKNAWCRVKTDLVFWRKDSLIIVDHKTGKRRPTHETQLSLYAIAGFLMYPEIDIIDSELWYLDHGKPIPTERYERHELPLMLEAWEERTRPMLSDTQFAPKPSRACSWCNFSKSNGGPCKF